MFDVATVRYWLGLTSSGRILNYEVAGFGFTKKTTCALRL
jgi:hypothetical protein